MLPLGNRHAFVMHVLLFEFVGVDEPELGGLDEVPVLVLVFELEAELEWAFKTESRAALLAPAAVFPLPLLVVPDFACAKSESNGSMYDVIATAATTIIITCLYLRIDSRWSKLQVESQCIYPLIIGLNYWRILVQVLLIFRALTAVEFIK